MVVAFSLSSCSKDDVKKDDKGTGYSFKDQDASGEIEGDSWTYEDGYVKEIIGGDDELTVNLFLTQDDDVCKVVIADGGNVSFVVPNATGVYEVTGDITGFTVSLVDTELSTHLATSGAVEIVSITETSVTGKIDVKSDDNNYINGNFTIDFCN